MEPRINVQSWFNINKTPESWVKRRNGKSWWKDGYILLGKEPSTSPLYITLHNYYLNTVWISFYRNGYPVDRQKEYISPTYCDIGAAGKWLTKEVKKIIKEAEEICKLQKTIIDANEKISLRTGFKISVTFVPDGALLLFLVPRLKQLIKDYERQV